MSDPVRGSSSRRRAPARRVRQGGRPARNARQRLLEAAGEVFAEKGFAHARGAEISRRAGVNAAAVNYYFGGMEGLHAAAVREAHHRLISLEALSAAVSGRRSARAKLQAVIDLATSRLSGAGLSWELTVLAREFVSPSAALVELREREILPKAGLLKATVGELLGLSPDHPAVALGCLGVLAPFVMLAIVDRPTLGAAFPALGPGAIDPDLLAQHLSRFMLSGLAALKRDVHKGHQGTTRA